MALAGMLALLCSAHPVAAQQGQTCGTQATALSEFVQHAMHADDQRDLVRYMRVKVVIGARDDGAGGLELAATPGRIQRDLDFANEVFARCGTGFQFHLCAPPVVVADPSLWDMSGGNASAMLANREPGAITIYYAQWLNMGNTGSASSDMVRVARYAQIETLAHELGHVLGLGHTFNSFDLELVDGSNCTTAGDALCDTPADPGNLWPGDVDVSTCTYTGNATDANGDVYAPMLRNLMCYSGCLKDTITPEQGQVMRAVADYYWVSLRRTTAPITIDPFPTVLCANAAPLSLAAEPGPGTFEGPFVVGSTLVNSPNPAGSYYVSYTPNVPPVGPQEQVDQLSRHSMPPVSLPTDSLRQTFQAGEDAELLAVEVTLTASAPITYRMRLYTGVDADTALVFDGIAPYANTDTAWIRFDLPPGIMQATGDPFTFIITGDVPFVVLSPGSVYDHGTSNLGIFDAAFRTWVLSEVCQTVTRMYDLYQVPARPILNLPVAACLDNATAIPFHADLNMTTSSEFLLDGEVATVLVPAELAIGDHLVQHIYTINTCTDTTEQIFSVNAPVEFTFPTIPSTICTEDQPFALVAEPPLGEFAVDGIPGDLLTPQDMDPGVHLIQHSYAGALDTITFADQQCTPYSVGWNGFLAPDSVVWQSFVPQQTGELEGIEITVDMYALERTLVLQLHDGVGPNGPLLWSDTITTDVFPALFATGTGLTMMTGSSYTFALIPMAGGEPNLFPTIVYMYFDGYPAGTAHVTGATGPYDIRFQEFISQRFACPVTTEFPLEVEICSGVSETAFADVRVGPNPFSDRLELRTGAAGINYELHTTDGRLLLQGFAAANSVDQLPLHDVASGSYVLSLWTADGQRAYRRLVRAQ